MQNNASGFSKGQKKLASYIKESFEKAAFMTAKQLGKTVGISESTVVRFATELGYDGYPEMQKAMRDMVLSSLTSVQRIEMENNRNDGKDFLQFVLQSDGENLRKTAEMIDRNDFDSAVQAIRSAGNIYILGARSAAPLAEFLGYYLKFLFPNVHMITTSGTAEVFERLISVSSADAVIAISFPRYCTATVKGACFCRSRGACVIGITDSKLSLLGQNCDYAIAARSSMVSLVDSLVAPLSVINALILALANSADEKLSESFAALERVWEEYNVYEKWEDNR